MEEIENNYKFLRENKFSENNEIVRSEYEDAQLKENLFIEDSSDYDSDTENEDREYGFSYENAKATYTEWIESLERVDKMMLSVF